MQLVSDRPQEPGECAESLVRPGLVGSGPQHRGPAAAGAADRGIEQCGLADAGLTCEHQGAALALQRHRGTLARHPARPRARRDRLPRPAMAVRDCGDWPSCARLRGRRCPSVRPRRSGPGDLPSVIHDQGRVGKAAWTDGAADPSRRVGLTGLRVRVDRIVSTADVAIRRCPRWMSSRTGVSRRSAWIRPPVRGADLSPGPQISAHLRARPEMSHPASGTPGSGASRRSGVRGPAVRRSGGWWRPSQRGRRPCAPGG